MDPTHDPLTKDYLDLIFSELGTLITEWEVRPLRAQRVDLWFRPEVARDDPRWAELGWLGKMAEGTCLFELFSSGPKEDEIEDLERKLITARIRDRKGEQQSALVMWCVCARPSGVMKAALGMQPMKGWPLGFYQRPGHGWMRMVMLPELPETRETLPLRIAGRDAVHARAKRELDALEGDPFWRHAATQLTQHWQLVEKQPQEVRAMVDLSLVRAWEEKVRNEGREEGREKGREEGVLRGSALTVLAVLAARGWTVDEETRARVLACSEDTVLERWAVRAVTALTLAAVFED